MMLVFFIYSALFFLEAQVNPMIKTINVFNKNFIVWSPQYLNFNIVTHDYLCFEMDNRVNSETF